MTDKWHGIERPDMEWFEAYTTEQLRAEMELLHHMLVGPRRRVCQNTLPKDRRGKI